MFERISHAKAYAHETLQTVRREGEQERMLHNARLQYADGAQQIASCMVIDSLATAVGDTQTAQLARDIRRDEERMQQFLADLMPDLTAGVAHDEIPISELPNAAVAR